MGRLRELLGSGNGQPGNVTARELAEILPFFVMLFLISLLGFSWWIEVLIYIAAGLAYGILRGLLKRQAPDQPVDGDEAVSDNNAGDFDIAPVLHRYVRVLAPLLTVIMFAVLLISQEAWVDTLERPGWVDSATGVAVIGWMFGAVAVALGIPKTPWILSVASVFGMLAQWGDTLGGEVGFDSTFYAVQGFAIALHFILVTGLALVPAVKNPEQPAVAVPFG